MPRRQLSRPDARAQKATLAVRAGAVDEDAAAYAGISPEEWADWIIGAFGDEIATIRAEAVIMANGVVRQAAQRNSALAGRIADRAAAVHDLERLRQISGVSD